MKNFLFIKLPIFLYVFLFIPVSMAQAIDHLPLTLQETVERVLKNNISISVASYTSKIQRAIHF